MGADPSISTPSAREGVLALADRLTAAPATPIAESVLKDPFFPAAADLHDEVEKGSKSADSISDKERLELISAKINPSGSVELAGEPYLLFTEKRQKIGDKVTVSIDEVEYEVEIVSIDKNRFRIRYNNLETPRSIK